MIEIQDLEGVKKDVFLRRTNISKKKKKKVQQKEEEEKFGQKLNVHWKVN